MRAHTTCVRESGLLGCYSVSLGQCFLTFRNKMAPSSSRSAFSNSPGFQASATNYMRTALYWVITQHISGNNPEERSTKLPWTSPSLMMKASRSFSSSQDANPVTQRHFPEDSERHRLCCRTLRSHIIRYFSTVVTLEVVCYWSARCFVIQDVLGSILVLETDYWTGVSSSLYLFPQTAVALKHIVTLQNHDLLTTLHSDGIHSAQLTDTIASHVSHMFPSANAQVRVSCPEFSPLRLNQIPNIRNFIYNFYKSSEEP
jgi:hypothetical protein